MERKAATFYHGTPIAIHETERPFLDPHCRAETRDEGDPETDGIFGTPSFEAAKLFAFKHAACLGTLRTSAGNVVIYNGPPPAIDATGYVYKVSGEPFRETLKRGTPSGTWVALEEDMPLLQTEQGETVRALPIEGRHQITLRSLLEYHEIKLLVLTNAVDREIFIEAVRDAMHARRESEFIRNALRRGWLVDVSDAVMAGVDPDTIELMIREYEGMI